MSNYLNSSRAITAAHKREMANRSSLFTVATTAFFAACVAAGMAISFALPVRQPATAYDLIQAHGEETDIVDSGLSFDDCLAVLPFLQSRGENVTCETASR